MVSNSKASKYLLYALGEIILVVIGILIALQINNWNEKRKIFENQNTLLKGLLQDAEGDLEQLELIKNHYSQRLKLFKKLDSSFQVSDELLKSNVSWSYQSPLDMFYRPPSLAISSGSYQALINSGESIIYRNPKLFSDVQEIQVKISQHLNSIYETIKTVENQLNWKWNQEIRKVGFSQEDLTKELIKDLHYFHEHILLYRQILGNTERYLTNLKNDIDEELTRSL